MRQNPTNSTENQEENQFKLTWRDYMIPFVLGVLLFFITFLVKNPFEADSLKDSMKYLSDDFMVPGALLFCMWGLSFSSSQGAFDGTNFAAKRFIGHIIPALGLQKGENYGDYKMKKNENRKRVLKEFLIASLFFILFAIVFVIVYECI